MNMNQTASQTSEEIRLIAGLGNPGAEYEGTRHNTGFAFIDRLLKRLPGSWEMIHAHNSFYWKGVYAGRRLFLQKPQTYMNLSGEAVGSLAGAEKIEPAQVLIVHDDMDLSPGKIRIRAGGGAGGHNGVISVMEHLGTEAFPRLRVGVGKMANGHGSADFVLSAFSAEERELMDQVLDMAADAVILSLRRGLGMAMALFNSKDLAPKPEEEKISCENTQDNKNIITHQEV